MRKPAKPIRLSLLILKHVRNQSDENRVEQWSKNLYFQYFSGEQHFKGNFSINVIRWPASSFDLFIFILLSQHLLSVAPHLGELKPTNPKGFY
jgi:hypothetical protein